jgi:hypothetical protein
MTAGFRGVSRAYASLNFIGDEQGSIAQAQIGSALEVAIGRYICGLSSDRLDMKAATGRALPRPKP